MYVETAYFTNLRMNLLTSSTEGIQAQNLMQKHTCDFPIKSFLYSMYIMDINMNKRLQNGEVA